MNTILHDGVFLFLPPDHHAWPERFFKEERLFTLNSQK